MEEADEEAYKIVREKTANRKKADKMRWDAKYHLTALRPGDRVLVQNKEKGGPGKLRSYWEQSIYVVKQQKGEQDLVYEVQREDGKGRCRVLHRNMLLPVGELILQQADTVVRNKKKNKKPLVIDVDDTSETSSDMFQRYPTVPAIANQVPAGELDTESKSDDEVVVTETESKSDDEVVEADTESKSDDEVVVTETESKSDDEVVVADTESNSHDEVVGEGPVKETERTVTADGGVADTEDRPSEHDFNNWLQQMAAEDVTSDEQEHSREVQITNEAVEVARPLPSNIDPTNEQSASNEDMTSAVEVARQLPPTINTTDEQSSSSESMTSAIDVLRDSCDDTKSRVFRAQGGVDDEEELFSPRKASLASEASSIEQRSYEALQTAIQSNSDITPRTKLRCCKSDERWKTWKTSAGERRKKRTVSSSVSQDERNERWRAKRDEIRRENRIDFSLEERENVPVEPQNALRQLADFNSKGLTEHPIEVEQPNVGIEDETQWTDPADAYDPMTLRRGTRVRKAPSKFADINVCKLKDDTVGEKQRFNGFTEEKCIRKVMKEDYRKHILFVRKFFKDL